MKLPYYKFMVQDWLSGDAQSMTLSEQAIFVNLCALIWKDGGVYSKPIAVLQHRCRIPIDELEEALNNMKELGIIYVDDNGFLRVKFMDEQMGELTQAHEQKVLAGKLGAAARYSKQSHSTAIAPPKQSDTDTDTDIYTEAFERCWKAYPNRAGSKHKALQAFKKARVNEQTVLDGIARYKAYVKQERKRGFTDLKYANGQTWFNQRRWEAEYECEGVRSAEEEALIKKRMAI